MRHIREKDGCSRGNKWKMWNQIFSFIAAIFSTNKTFRVFGRSVAVLQKIMRHFCNSQCFNATRTLYDLSPLHCHYHKGRTSAAMHLQLSCHEIAAKLHNFIAIFPPAFPAPPTNPDLLSSVWLCRARLPF